MGGLRKRYCGVSIASTKCIWRSLVNFSERYHSPHDVRMLTERSYPIKRYLIISTKTTRKGHFISIPSLIASSFYISKWCCFLFSFVLFFAFQTVYIESSFDRNTFLVYSKFYLKIYIYILFCFYERILFTRAIRYFYLPTSSSFLKTSDWNFIFAINLLSFT